ncbi:dirigent protein 23-like [Neltuma alba]|uniref:dirigent protein 23-like n=1 Tax=Neltuma alba TaxID=207710 RepID=UPI0010A56967|nr:dirigent protein 23-like [Prosopis alba]
MSKQAFEMMMLVLLMAAAMSPLRAAAEAEKKETVTNLHFYFHDILSGKNPTAVRVVEPVDTYKSTTLFGVVMMADDPLTETPDPNSKLVGRAQGLYTSACQQELGLLMSMSFSFTDGSSISILGKNSAMNPVREMPVVGGTGKFRLARGYALAHTHWLNPATGDAIVAYNVTVIQ